jgi:ABC-type transport system involved in cytochrome bd biosynthesis fused ATPase/permease subunit
VLAARRFKWGGVPWRFLANRRRQDRDGREDALPTAPHAADGHNLIRVHGARANNLKNVGVEIPKRRLTVFTGVAGSGKSSPVLDTIAAESQRLIHGAGRAVAAAGPPG